MIESLEPVLIVNLLGCSEIDRGVTELECLRSRSKREWTGRIDSVTIRENVLDDDRGCGRGRSGCPTAKESRSNLPMLLDSAGAAYVRRAHRADDQCHKHVRSEEVVSGVGEWRR